jgi:cytoskeletal protein CcmA (bactofilin family)
MRPLARTRLFKALAATGLAALIAACGGGGGIGGTGTGGNDTGGGGGGGIGGTGMAYGTITGFGSVWVNGVEFSTSGTDIRIDDSGNHTQGELRIGMVVRVDGSIANKTATTISVDDAVKGTVESVIDADRLVVMGQTVQMDAGTTREGAPFARGDSVEVHGLVVGDGSIAAGYVQKKTPATLGTLTVKGLVKNHNTAASTFQVGTLTVSYAGAITGDMPAGSWNGVQVDVKGSACAASPVCGTLTATKLEPAGANVASASQAEVEGFVDAFTNGVDASGGFTINNQKVALTGSTKVEGGLLSEITLGTKLEAEGSISGGVLTATKISLRDNARLEGDIASVDSASSSITLAGLPGVTIKVNGLTQFKTGNFASLSPNNHLRIRGRLAGSNTSLVATELEVRSTSTDKTFIVQSTVTAVAAPNLTLMGQTINTSGISENSFNGLGGTAIGRAAFFSAVKVGTLVKANADWQNGVLTWKEVELESD